MSKINYAIDEFHKGKISGWVILTDTPNEHAVLEFDHNGDILLQVVANKYRPDLKDAGIGNGDHAFTASFEPPLSNDELANIYIRPKGYSTNMVCDEQQSIRRDLCKTNVYLEISDLINFLRHEKRVTGIQRLVSQLCTALITEDRRHHYKFCALLSESSNEFVELDRDCLIVLLKAILNDVKGDSLVPFINKLIEDTIPISPKHSDVLLGTGASFSFVNYPLAVKQIKNEKNLIYGTILYDLIPYHSRNTLPPDLSIRFSLWLSEIAKIADFVVSISEYTSKEFEEFCKENKINNSNLKTNFIPLGSHTPKRVAKSSVNKRYFIEDEFCIFVSTIETRKNHAALIRAWQIILADNQNAAQLVIIGKKGWGFDELISIISSDEFLESKVLLVHDASDSDLEWLYQNSLFSIYPSLYEGWGLPVTESLARGKFCICSNTTSLPEAGGKFTDYFDPTDVTDIAKIISCYLNNRGLLAEKEKNIVTNFNLRTWHDYATDMDLWIEKVCKVEPCKTQAQALKSGTIYHYSKNKKSDEHFFDFIENRAAAYSALNLGEWFVPEDAGRWLHGNHGTLRFTINDFTTKKIIKIYLKYWLAVNVESMNFDIYANGQLAHARHLAGAELQGHKLIRFDAKADEDGFINIEFRRKRYKRNGVTEPRDLFICLLAIAAAISVDERIDILEDLII